MDKRPDNIALFCFMTAGVYFCYLMLNNPWLSLLLIPAGIFLFIKSSKIYLSLFLTGIVLFMIRNYGYSMNDHIPDRLSGKEITVSGSVYSVQEHSINSNLIISVDTISFNGKPFAADLKCSAVLPLKNSERGDRIKFRGKFREFSEPTNMYEKDMEQYAFINNLYGEILSPDVVTFTRQNSVWRKISKLQDAIIEVFDKRLSFSTGNFLTAVMIGKRDKLESSVIRDFADSGTIHLLAVSGLHVGFLILILSLLSGLFNLKGAVYIFVNSAALLSYAVFTGASSSVIRAVLMSIIIMLSYPLKRKLKFIDVIGTAGIVSLIYDPNQIFNPGFILSFTAVASIAVIYEKVSAVFYKKFNIRNHFLKKIADGLVLSFSVTIGLLPFVLYIFGKYNLLSIVSNVALIPLTGAAFMFGIVLLLVDKVEILAEFVSDIINMLGYMISAIVEVTAEAELFTMKYKFGIAVAAVLIGTVITVFYIKKYHYKLIIIIVFIAILVIQIMNVANVPYLYAFNTKMGGSVIISSCGENILIAGKLSVSDIRRIINPYLLEMNVTELDYLITAEEWYITEKTLTELSVPVKHLVSDRDYSNITGDFEIINLNYINRIIKFTGGMVYFFYDGKFKIFTNAEKFSSDDLFDSNRGIEHKF